MITKPRPYPPGSSSNAASRRHPTSSLRKEESELDRLCAFIRLQTGTTAVGTSSPSPRHGLPGRGPLARSARSISVATASSRPHGTRARCGAGGRRPAPMCESGTRQRGAVPRACARSIFFTRVPRARAHGCNCNPASVPCSRRLSRCSCLRPPAVVHGVVAVARHDCRWVGSARGHVCWSRLNNKLARGRTRWL